MLSPTEIDDLLSVFLFLVKRKVRVRGIGVRVRVKAIAARFLLQFRISPYSPTFSTAHIIHQQITDDMQYHLLTSSLLAMSISLTDALAPTSVLEGNNTFPAWVKCI